MLTDGRADDFALGTAEIVDDDEVAGLEHVTESLFDIKPEALAIDLAGDKTVEAQCRQECHGVPMAEGHLGFEPPAARCPSAQRRHVGFCPCLVDEDEAIRPDPVAILCPLSPSSRDAGTNLFSGVYGFF